MFLTVVYACPSYFFNISWFLWWHLLFASCANSGICIIFTWLVMSNPSQTYSTMTCSKTRKPKHGTTHIIGLPASIPPPEFDLQTSHNGMYSVNLAPAQQEKMAQTKSRELWLDQHLTPNGTLKGSKTAVNSKNQICLTCQFVKLNLTRPSKAPSPLIMTCQDSSIDILVTGQPGLCPIQRTILQTPVILLSFGLSTFMKPRCHRVDQIQ